MINKNKIHKRLLLDMGVLTINNLYDQLSAYKKYMSEENFNNSKEVQQTYDELERLIQIDNIYIYI